MLQLVLKANRKVGRRERESEGMIDRQRGKRGWSERKMKYLVSTKTDQITTLRLVLKANK